MPKPEADESLLHFAHHGKIFVTDHIHPLVKLVSFLGVSVNMENTVTNPKGWCLILAIESLALEYKSFTSKSFSSPFMNFPDLSNLYILLFLRTWLFPSFLTLPFYHW